MSPNRIVITGTIGSGKSAVSDIIRKLGFKVIDSDRVNKHLLEEGEANYLAIKKDPFFKKAFDGKDLDKKRLAEMIFSSADLMKRLNKISHPNIILEIEKEIERSTCENIFIEIPLYYQMEISFVADLILFVKASKEIQSQRLAKRDNIGKLYAQTKIKNQEDSIKNRDDKEIVVNNDGSLLDLKEEIIKILKKEKIYEAN